MLSALLIIAFVYPVVYGIRRFILKEPKYTGDVDGDMNTRPIVALAVAVSVGFAILATAILLLLGVRDTRAMGTTAAGTILIAFYFMRK